MKKFNKTIFKLTIVSLFFVFSFMQTAQAQINMSDVGATGGFAADADSYLTNGTTGGLGVEVNSYQLASGQKQQSLFDKALDALKAGLAKSGSMAFQSGLTTMLNTLAYDAANYVANGMTGQKSAFEQRSFGDLFKDSLDAAAGDFLSTLGSKGFSGLNLCEPTLGLKGKIGLGLYQAQRPKPKCTFSEMRNNWETELRDPNFLTNFQDYFEPTSNDLGIALSANTMFFQKQANDATAKLEEYKMNQGWLNVRNIAGNTKTPASMIKASTEKDLIKSPEDVVKFTGDALVDALNIFLNQLAIQLLRNLLYGGLTSGSGSSNSLYNYQADYSSGGGTAAAKDQFRKIMQPRFDVRGDYDILAELTQCPDPTKAGPTNCVITEKFRQAVQGRKTVGQAMTEGMLNAGGTFGFSKFNEEPRYQDENYPYRSLLILRKFRIIPVGWELAAGYINAKFNEGGAKTMPLYTLENLINCFDPDDEYNGKGNGDKWCEDLIDPDWVLKAPLNYCAREGYGPEIFGEAQISSDGGYNIQRKDNYCADEQACVKENSDGSCEVYGYCTEERRTWNFGNNSCNPLYNTCQTFAKADGASVSYLKNTLSWCDASGAGCESYATNYDYSKSQWQTGNEIYLNNNAGSCDSASEGCHEFLRIEKSKVENLAALPASGSLVSNDYYNSTSTVYEKLLPKYLANGSDGISGACYEIKSGAYQLKVDAPAICGNFVRQCAQTEVGCESYTRVRDGFAVPAKVKTGDYCPQACDGYDLYIQEETTFEAPKDQYFIPDTAKTCSAQGAGCDQFTNLDEVAKGGEGIEYYSVLRQCVTDGTQAATFYTWEGSDETGFQLRAFSLKKDKINDNRPAVFDNAGGLNTEDQSTVCNADIFSRAASDPFYNSDCRQFYAKNGTISYRLYTHTISFDTNCHPYRRSEPIVAGSDDADKCTAMGGDLNVASGYCVYMAIPQQGVQCSASENKCREYKGNVSNNVRVVFTDDFEKGTYDWQKSAATSGTDIAYVNEASKSLYHSLKITKNSGAISTIEKTIGGLMGSSGAYNKSFTLEMMVKGTKDNNIKPAFKYGSASKSFGEEKFSGDWQKFSFGLKFSDLEKYVPAATDMITLESSASDYFIDYIILRETAETYYLIKDSWNTPAACTPDMQGCYEYRDRADSSYYLKSFSGFCSESGVGCELMIDTQNYTPREGKNFGSGANISADKFIYLVYDESKICGADNKGCQRLGRPNRYGDKIINHSDAYLLNNPDRYETTLCGADQVGCSEYKDNNATYYFRDPGEGVCEYRQGYYGYMWYKKQTKRCTGTDGKTISDHKIDNICAVDGDCKNAAQKCILDAWDEKCPVDDAVAPKTIGLGGAGNRIYQPNGWVGVCPAAESGCTEIIDSISQPAPNLLNKNQAGQTITIKQNTLYVGSKNLSVENPTQKNNFFHLDPAQNKLVVGTPVNANNNWLVFSNNQTGITVKPVLTNTYFREAIVNYQLASGLDSSACNGQPNYTDGCVLFNQRSVNGGSAKELVYDADVEQKKNTATQQLTACAKGGDACDSNTVLKVQHDRVCSEWLACRSYALVDDDKKKNQKICYDIGTCDGLDEANQCKSWVSGNKKNQTIDLGEVSPALGADKGISKDLTANMTGYSQVGFWNNAVNTEGSFNLGSMEQSGDLTIVPNGNFEVTNTEGVPSGWDLRNNNATASLITKEIKTNMVSVISTPQQAQKLSVTYPVEGHNILSLGVAFQLHSQVPLEVSPNNKNYTITAQINTKSLTSGKAQIIVWGVDSNTSLTTIDQSAGVGWSSKFKRFDSGSNKQIKIIITTDDSTKPTGNVFVDDIQIRPTLQTRLGTANNYGSTDVGDYWYTQQSCRLYPKADSLSCDYIDDSSIRQKGWYGYCLQYDRAPGNPNACLLWWPVNMVRGDGVDEQVAAYSGRAPLYYCTQSEGPYCAASESITLTFDTTSCDGGADITSCPTGKGKGSIGCGACINKEGYLHVFSAAYEKYDCEGYLIDPAFELLQSDDCWAQWVSKDPIIDVTGINMSGELPIVGNKNKQYTYKAIHSLTNKQWFPISMCAVSSKSSQTFGAFAKDSNINIILKADSSAKPEILCTNMIQTVDPVGQNKIWSSRMKEGSKLDLLCSDKVKNTDICRYESDLYPFGSIAYPEPVDNPTQWVDVGNFNVPLTAGEASDQARFRYVYDDPSPAYNLKYLFVKSFGEWKWDWSAKGYVTSGSGGITAPTTKCSDKGKHELQYSDPHYVPKVDSYCAIPPEITGIKVNGANSSEIKLSTSNPLAHLTFTTFIDNDQLPLTEVRVNWGDGYTTSVSGAELRSRPSTTEPFSYYHVYNCNQSSCTFKPSVWIKDNWGWYSGNGSLGTPPTVPDSFGGTIVVNQ
ncbi:MAG: hypothetical protein WCV41_00350 [Patescibacteria group bacterium]